MKINKFTPVVAAPHTPPYKIHKYFARRPWNVFEQLIKVFSHEEQIILDPFCGGGVTIYEGIKLNRKVVGFDLNPLSIFVTKNMIEKSIDLKKLDLYYQKISKYISYIYYGTDVLENQEKDKLPLSLYQPQKVLWEELAYKIKCPYCGQIFLLSNENKISNGRYSCDNKACEGNRGNGGKIDSSKCERLGYEYIFSVINSESSKNNNNHVYVNDKRRETFANHIIFLENECKREQVEVEFDIIPLEWDRQNEDLLFRKGIISFQDFFTRRNLLINILLLNYIKKMQLDDGDEKSREVLRLVFSSSLRDTNVMSFTSAGWQSGKPTTWSKHAYWTPSQFCEVNVLVAFRQAFNRMRDSILFNQNFNYTARYAEKFSDLNQTHNIYLKACSVDSVEVPENFLDAIITDPPYGSNVQYLELSHFWFPWNKDIYGTNSSPDFAKEAVANRKSNFIGAKDFKDYEQNLFLVFRQCYKALKPEKYLVFTFNNKDIRAWLALLIAIFRAGFVFEPDGLIYQNGVENYKQTSHTKSKGSPYGDFIHIFQKTEQPMYKESQPKSEMEFFSDLDTIFSKHLWELENKAGDRNELITRMFSEVIPMVQNFVNSSEFDVEKSNIYSVFGKEYLESLHQYD